MSQPVLCILALLAGCATTDDAVSTPTTPPLNPNPVAEPATPRKIAPPANAATAEAAAAALARDSAALQDQATTYVTGSHSQTQVIDQLTILTMRSNLAMDKMETNRVGKVYRKADIAEARAAADALAAYMHSRARTP
jgi:hypothetical protein